MYRKDSILKTVAAALAFLAVPAFAAPLEKNVEDIEAARTAIEAAINAKGGNARGGLINAAEDIINIVEKTKFECDYIAWSNALVEVNTIQTNIIAEYQFKLLPYIQANGNQFIKLDGVYANQDTFIEFSAYDLSWSGEMDFFGIRSGSAIYGMHIFSSQVSFPYYNSWNDYKGAATSDMVLKMDANMFYINGALAYTASKPTFRTSYEFGVFNQNDASSSYRMKGKLRYIILQRAVDQYGTQLPDMHLLPALDPDGRPCLLDMESDRSKPPVAFYSRTGTDPLYSSETNTYQYVQKTVTGDQYSCIFPVCYQTNVVGSADNALIANDGEAEVWNRMAEMVGD